MDLKQQTVLIVDDSSIIRRAIAKFLAEFDIEIIGTAQNGNSALELFKEHRPDLVTLDITMPGLDGFNVLKEMVKIDRDCKIIVITALADKATGLKALKIGAKSYLNKPFTAQKFKTTFKRIIEEN